jgi:hypothetical protein
VVLFLVCYLFDAKESVLEVSVYYHRKLTVYTEKIDSIKISSCHSDESVKSDTTVTFYNPQIL